MVDLLDPLKYLGAATVAFLAYKAARFVSLYVRPSDLHRYHHGKPGSTWALITGASDGIGYAFADALCGEGFNVLLHGRNEKKLTVVREKLQNLHPKAEIRFVIADASELTSGEETLVSAAQSLPGKVTILINNVGGSPYEPVYGTLSESSADKVDKLINLNARFPTQVTRALFPLLSTNKPSLVMNIGSAAGQLGLPFLSVYSAAKAFNKTFSEALNIEVAATGLDIEILGIIVGAVATDSNDAARIAGFTPTAKEMATYSLARIGCGRSVVWGWWRHALQGVFLDVAPTALAQPFLISTMREAKVHHEKTQ